jgi:hypothetical protein
MRAAANAGWRGGPAAAGMLAHITRVREEYVLYAESL